MLRRLLFQPKVKTNRLFLESSPCRVSAAAHGLVEFSKHATFKISVSGRVGLAFAFVSFLTALNRSGCLTIYHWPCMLEPETHIWFLFKWDLAPRERHQNTVDYMFKQSMTPVLARSSYVQSMRSQQHSNVREIEKGWRCDRVLVRFVVFLLIISHAGPVGGWQSVC